jgi:hypothetical protein
MNVRSGTYVASHTNYEWSTPASAVRLAEWGDRMHVKNGGANS